MLDRLVKIVETLELRRPLPVEVPASVDVDDPSLTDLSALPFVTIDNEDSRDLDQALYIERAASGFRTMYAIADAAWFVRPGTDLFEYALRRGASFYFPGFALPMLPRSLSEGIISLNEGAMRRAVVFDMTVDADGEISGTRLHRARIRSVAKLSYDGVQQWFDEGAPDGEPWASSVRLLRDVGECRAKRARSRGVVEFDRTEAEVVAIDGHFEVQLRTRNDVERWNEQLSLMCNTEGARLMREARAGLDDLQSVYRVHLPPLDRRLRELQSEIATLCDRHHLDDAWRWDGEQPLSAYLNAIPDEPWRARRAIELQIRHTNRASEYSDRVGPHFALAVEQYARFSAPMREIVGVFTHKEALEALDLQKSAGPQEDETLRSRVIEAGNEARRLQKRIDKEVMLLAIGDLLGADLGEPEESRRWRCGTVVGLRATRLYVQLDELRIDVKVYTDNLAAVFGTRFELVRHELQGADGTAFGLGDRIDLRAARYEAQTRRYFFDIRRA